MVTYEQMLEQIKINNFNNRFSDIRKQLSPLEIQILDFIILKGSLTRRQLVELTKRARTTVYDRLKYLKYKGIVESYSKREGKHGRPKVYWRCL